MKTTTTIGCAALAAWLLNLPLSLPAAAQAPAAQATPAAAQPFSFDTVVAEAQALAAKPFDAAPPPLPAALQSLSYDEFRKIHHPSKRALWLEEALPFNVTFFHRGWLNKQQIQVSLVENGQAAPLAYRGDWFDYHDLVLPPLPADLGYAGLRILYPLNQPDKADEMAAFLGASYFRPLAKGLHYGLSIRGLAIDSGLPTGEEFPAFTKYWLETPAKDATTFTMYALLDSQSITGAYKLVLDPGDVTVIDVEAQLFPRTSIQKLGVAPVTSMYLYGEGDQRPPYDFRPEVHDSDGLLIANGSGEWLWRPLANPKGTRISQFLVKDLKGYGLMQRDREFDHYEDVEALYNDRPSAWVEPIEGFGAGKIDLLEIASDDEGMDNVVAAYVPERPVVAGGTLSYKYRLHIAGSDPAEHRGGKAVATRRMWRPEGFVHKTITVPPGVMRFLIDFDGPAIDALDEAAVEKAKTAELVATATNGEVSNRVAHYNPEAGSWRTFLDVKPIDRTKAVDIRAFLKNGDDVLTETWVYSWNP